MKSGRTNTKDINSTSSTEQTRRKEIPATAKSILELGKGDNIHTLMRQNNYSTNALNLKTLNILQQINAKSFGVRSDGKGRRNMVAFLRKVA